MDSSEVVDQFFALKSPRDIPNLLGIDSDKLRYHLYILPSENRYRIFYIQKKSGGYRKISVPISNLKLIQKKLKEVLSFIYRPNEFVVHGFVPKRNIVTNAKMHCNSDYKAKHLFNIDLVDFFPSINFGRVRGLFMARPYSLSPSVATILAQICCFDNELPQGAPTSPIISNMICRNLDDELNRLAHDFRCVYTRYADDLTFSTDLTRGFPIEIVEYNSLEDIKPGKQLTHIIEENGFNINYKKVRLQNPLCRQEVTGLIINSSNASRLGEVRLRKGRKTLSR
jgi:RNA-directed DNA polymerase